MENEPQKTAKRRAIIVRAAIYTITLLLITVLLIAVLRLNGRIREIEQRILGSEEAIAAFKSADEGVRSSDSVYYSDPNYGNMWVNTPVTAPKNTYDYNKLTFENNRYYYKDGDFTSATGVDVSYHQGDIDWVKAAADGIDFAIMRLGYRGYETNLLNLDERFDEYCAGADAAGIKVGAYFYSHAKTAEEAAEEADFVIENLAGKNITYPVFFDWEATSAENVNAAAVTPEELTDYARIFCDRIASAGYKPMVYGSLKLLMCKTDIDALAQYGFWYAEYHDGADTPDFEYNFDIWQYASDGTVDGINGGVDMNVCFADYTGSSE